MSRYTLEAVLEAENRSSAAIGELSAELTALDAQLKALDTHIDIDVGVDSASASAKLTKLAEKARSVGAIDVEINVKVNSNRALTELATIAMAARSTGAISPEIKVKADTRSAHRSLGILEGRIFLTSGVYGTFANALFSTGPQLITITLLIGALAAAFSGLAASLGILGIAALGIVGGFGLIAAAAIPVVGQIANLNKATKEQAQANEAAETAARSYASAQDNLAQAQEAAARQVQSAERGLAAAHSNLEQATRDLSLATQDYNRALADENERIARLTLNTDDLKLSQKENAQAITKATQDLNKARASGDASKIADAELRLERLYLSQRQNALSLQDAEEKLSDARVNGSTELMQQTQQLASASERREQAASRVQDAEIRLAETQSSSARQVVQAQAQLAEASEKLSKAQDEARAKNIALSGSVGILAASWTSLRGTFSTAFKPASDAVALLSAQVLDLANRAMPTLGRSALANVNALQATFTRLRAELNSPVERRSVLTILSATPEMTSLATSALGKFGAALVNVFAIGTPYAVGFLRELDKLAQRFLDYTRTAEGQKRINDFFKDAKPIMESLERAAGKFFPWLIDFSDKHGEDVVKSIDSVTNAFAELDKGLKDIDRQFRPVADWLNRINSAGSDAGKSVRSMDMGITNTLKGLVGFLGGIAKQIFDTMTQPWRSAYQIIVGRSIVPDMVRDIIGWFQGLPDGITNALKSIPGNIGGIFQRSAEEGSKQLQWLADNADKSSTDAKNWLVRNFTDARDSGIDRLTGLRDAGTERMWQLSGNVSDAMGNARDNIKWALNDAQVSGVAALTILKDVGAGAMNAAGSLFQDPIGGASRGIQGYMNDMLYGMREVIRSANLPLTPPEDFKVRDSVGATRPWNPSGMALGNAAGNIIPMASGGISDAVFNSAAVQGPVGGVTHNAPVRVYGEVPGTTEFYATDNEAYVDRNIEILGNAITHMRNKFGEKVDQGLMKARKAARIPFEGLHIPELMAAGGITLIALAEGGSLNIGKYPTSGWGLNPFAAQVAYMLNERFQFPDIGGWRPADWAGEHSTGNAMDLMTYEDKPKGDSAADFILANAGEINPKWLIWQQAINSGSGWQAMEDRGDPTQNHMDHIHLFLVGEPGSGGQWAGGGLGRNLQPLIDENIPQVPDLGAFLPAEAAEGLGKNARAAVVSELLKYSRTSSPSGSFGPAPSGVLRDWIVSGTRLGGVFADTPDVIDALYSRAIQESGGDPSVINTWDSNYYAGTPSKGLMQIIEPTWEANTRPDIGSFEPNWSDPVKSVAVSTRYMDSRYGYPVGATGVGYTSGGIALKPHMASVAEDGPELFMPLHNPDSARVFLNFLRDLQPKGYDSVEERQVRRIKTDDDRVPSPFMSTVNRTDQVSVLTAEIAALRKTLGQQTERIDYQTERLDNSIATVGPAVKESVDYNVEYSMQTRERIKRGQKYVDEADIFGGRF